MTQKTSTYVLVNAYGHIIGSGVLFLILFLSLALGFAPIRGLYAILSLDTFEITKFAAMTSIVVTSIVSMRSREIQVVLMPLTYFLGFAASLTFASSETIEAATLGGFLAATITSLFYEGKRRDIESKNWCCIIESARVVTTLAIVNGLNFVEGGVLIFTAREVDQFTISMCLVFLSSFTFPIFASRAMR